MADGDVAFVVFVTVLVGVFCGVLDMLPKPRTAEDVLREILRGLEDGSVVLGCDTEDDVSSPPALEPLVCMMCCREANDSPTGWETDEYGDVWAYCRSCDVWTSHPPERIGSTREECRRWR